MTTVSLKIEVFDNVFDALADTPEEAVSLTARADLMLSTRAENGKRSDDQVLHGASPPVLRLRSHGPLN